MEEPEEMLLEDELDEEGEEEDSEDQEE